MRRAERVIATGTEVTSNPTQHVGINRQRMPALKLLSQRTAKFEILPRMLTSFLPFHQRHTGLSKDTSATAFSSPAEKRLHHRATEHTESEEELSFMAVRETVCHCLGRTWPLLEFIFSVSSVALW